MRAAHAWDVWVSLMPLVFSMAVWKLRCGVCLNTHSLSHDALQILAVLSCHCSWEAVLHTSTQLCATADGHGALRYIHVGLRGGLDWKKRPRTRLVGAYNAVFWCARSEGGARNGVVMRAHIHTNRRLLPTLCSGTPGVDSFRSTARRHQVRPRSQRRMCKIPKVD